MLTHNSNNERNMKQEQRYVWISNRAPVIVLANELELLYKDPKYNAENDKIFELGPEVKLKMQIVTIPTHPVTRSFSEANKE